MTHDYKRQGTSTEFAALNTVTGDVIGDAVLNGIGDHEFLTFLKAVEKQTPKELDLHRVVDNYATRSNMKPAVKNWIKRNKRIHLHFIPTRWIALKCLWTRSLDY